ncbi:hypothetical protein BH24ACT13_BH24ACT13_01360 [soil metagenome]|jgi:hypothetical protein
MVNLPALVFGVLLLGAAVLLGGAARRRAAPITRQEPDPHDPSRLISVHQRGRSSLAVWAAAALCAGWGLVLIIAAVTARPPGSG